ncbi:MAG: Z1 domain-containing protein [Mucispirillum sp.]|nr:Z1 domain-containing protein [Mucispirillum sp.]
MSQIDDFLIAAEAFIESKKNSNNKETLDENELDDIFNTVLSIIKLNKEELTKAKSIIYSRMSVKMDRGTAITYNHKPWYSAYKSTKDSFPFWQRYKTYLLKDKKFTQKVVNKLDESTDDIMDLLANPLTEKHFSRRGLVIGDVQSGKTATYIALINKAADAGYKVIILLTGIIEKLRQQTQGRIDEGFTGLDSNAVEKNTAAQIGVSKYNSLHNMAVMSFTTTLSDFKRSATRQVISNNLTNPVIFVVKKNKSILEQLQQWLVSFNAVNNYIEHPMLLIDDEADAASINTNNDDTNPTAINKAIRSLLKVFIRSNYVAFTATPYANIFINPDSTDEMLKDDLFPKDFIYSLNAPSNYIGASSIFIDSEDDDGKIIPAKYKYMLHNNNDCEDWVPEKHKKDYYPKGLPNSIKEAIASFLIVNAVRDLRGHVNSHRTMLINISRYINVQNKITEIIKEYLIDIVEEIRNYSKMEDALKHSSIKFIKEVYDKYYANLYAYLDSGSIFSWKQIQENLYSASASIITSSVNGGNASKILDYENHEQGLRLIAVGGLSLSRGLTLEGLAVSYFHRNSRMYDTLMQMGRWFGYRTGYEDLCQIWMTTHSQEWYSYIAEATDELRRDIIRMHYANRTPDDFGLQVRSEHNSLLVTAINKMRTSWTYEITISLSGLYKETPYITSNIEENQFNLETVNALISSLITKDEINNPALALSSKHQFLNIPKQTILDFLSLFKTSTFNIYNGFNDRNETGFIVNLLQQNTDTILDKWDILISSGTGRDCNIGSITVKKIIRNFSLVKNHAGILSAFKMSGSKSRLGNAGDAKGGLNKKDADTVIKNYRDFLPENDKDKIIPGKRFFEDTSIKRNPLLVIYPVELKNDTDNQELNNMAQNYSDITLIGIAVGIPVFKDSDKNQTCRYIINKKKYEENTGFNENECETDEIENG